MLLVAGSLEYPLAPDPERVGSYDAAARSDADGTDSDIAHVR